MTRKSLGIWIVLLLVLGCCLTCFAHIPAFAVESGPTTDRGPTVTFDLKISKVDQGTGLPVGGAEFLLAREDGSYLRMEKRDTLLWTETEGEGTVLVTDDKGTFTVKGLEPGIYYLTETKAPNGYELLTESVRIEITPEYAQLGDGAREVTGLAVQCEGGEVCHNSADRWDYVEIKVKNAYGTVLPATGGMGTAVFYVFGMVVLFVVALIVVAKRILPVQ